jgi:hypothetical protein
MTPLTWPEVAIWAMAQLLDGSDVAVADVLHRAPGLPVWKAAPLLAAIGISLNCTRASMSASGISAPSPVWARSIAAPDTVDGGDDIIFRGMEPTRIEALACSSGAAVDDDDPVPDLRLFLAAVGDQGGADALELELRQQDRLDALWRAPPAFKRPK